MKTVSVIIPVYGVEKYLMRCVDSVLAQTYSALQIILVDDGSPDRCPVLCDEYAQRDSRISVIHKPNGGLSSARNAGLEAAVGEYICFFDSDDYIESDMIEKLVLAIEENNDDVCVCGYYVDSYDGQECLLSTKAVVPDFPYPKSNFSLDKYDKILGWCGYAWNKLYRLSLIKNCGFHFEEGASLVEDLLFNQQVFCGDIKIRFLQYSGYHYIQRKRETLGVRYYEDFFELKEKAIEAKCAILRKWGVEEDVIAQFYANTFIDTVWSTIKNIQTSNLDDKIKKEKLALFLKEHQIKARLGSMHRQGLKRRIKKFLLRILNGEVLLKVCK